MEKNLEISAQKTIISIPRKDENLQNMFNRDASVENNNNLKIFDNSNSFKEELSYNSLLAHYNMNVIGFQDENKLYEENISRINSIKNKNVINIKHEFNFNSIKKIKCESNQLRSNQNKLTNNFIIMKLNFIPLERRKMNISLDLDKKHMNIPHVEFIHKKYPISERIKTNVKEMNIELIGREKKDN